VVFQTTVELRHFFYALELGGNCWILIGLSLILIKIKKILRPILSARYYKDLVSYGILTRGSMNLKG
jgi:hypothetical protein